MTQRPVVDPVQSSAVESAPCEHERAIDRLLACPLLPAPPPVKGLAPPTHSVYSRDLVPGPCDHEPEIARAASPATSEERSPGKDG